METLRSFISIDIMEENIVNKIINLERKFSENLGRIKFVDCNNLHLTLKFLGDIKKPSINEIIENLSLIPLKPFNFYLKGVGCFDSKFPRVIWIGIFNTDELKNLQKEIDIKLEKLGFLPEKRGFTPHLTIGRVKSVKDKVSLLSKIKEFEELDFGEIKFNNFRLKKSTLTPQGPIYEIIKEFCLEGI